MRGGIAEMNLIEQARRIPHGVAVITEWLGSGGEIVSKEVAQDRANTCLDCPLNQPSGIVTATVAKAVRNHLEVKNQIGLRVNGEKRLGSCEACGCVLRLLVWLPGAKVRSELTENEIETLPENCWKLKA